MSYRLLAGAEDDIDRILLKSARDWGIAAASRYNRIMLASFEALSTDPMLPGSALVVKVTGVRIYPLRHARRLVEPDQRVDNPRHIVVYRLGSDGIVEIIGLAHDRMLLARAARRMLRGIRR